MNCNEFKELILDYLGNELNKLQLKSFVEHSISCASCARDLLLEEKLVRMIKESPRPQIPDFYPTTGLNQVRRGRRLAIALIISSAAAFIFGILTWLTNLPTNNTNSSVNNPSRDLFQPMVALDALKEDILDQVKLDNNEIKKLDQVLDAKSLLEVAKGTVQTRDLIEAVTGTKFSSHKSVRASSQAYSLESKINEYSFYCYPDCYVKTRLAKWGVEDANVTRIVRDTFSNEIKIQSYIAQLIKEQDKSDAELGKLISSAREETKKLLKKNEENIKRLINTLDTEKLLNVISALDENPIASEGKQDQYEEFTDKFIEFFQVTREEAEKFTQTLKEIRNQFEEIVPKVEELVGAYKAVVVRNWLPGIDGENVTKMRLDLDTESLEKLVVIAIYVQDMMKEWKEKLESVIPKKIRRYLRHNYYGEGPFNQLITQKRLYIALVPGHHSIILINKKLDKILPQMNIKDKDVKEKVKNILSEIFEQAEEEKIERVYLFQIPRKTQDKTDTEVEMLKESLGIIKACENKIMKLEDELRGIVTARQFLMYIKYGF